MCDKKLIVLLFQMDKELCKGKVEKIRQFLCD